MHPDDPFKGDVVQQSMGMMGRWHVCLIIAIFLCKFPVGWHQLSHIFLAPPANFTCKNNADKCASNCSGHVFDRSVFKETIVTQWDLVCQRTYLAEVSQSVNMLGILVGNLLIGGIADRFGRRGPLIGATMLQVASGCIAAFSPWYSLFLSMRFLCALATGGCMVVSFVLIMEIVGIQWRTTVGILYQIPTFFAITTLPLIAYFIRDWHYYQFALSAPAAVLISYWCILPESPRWLITQGQTDKAIEVLESAAYHNGLPTENIRSNIESYLHRNPPQKKKGGNFVDLVRTPIMRVYTICVGYNWFVCGLCFYGGNEYVGHLGGNIFLNVAFSSGMQIPGTLFAVWAVKALGRRGCLIFSCLLGGIPMIMVAGAPAKPQWIAEMLCCVAIFGLTSCFSTVYIYAGELFPTIVRNAGVGTCSMCARIGSVSAPFVVLLSSKVKWAPPLIFGIVPVVGALLCLKLPETLDCKLPDTVEEAEEFARADAERGFFESCKNLCK